jgi:hypothetical protein
MYASRWRRPRRRSPVPEQWPRHSRGRRTDTQARPDQRRRARHARRSRCARRRADGIVVQIDRDVRKAILEPFPQRKAAPRPDVERRHPTRRPLHRTAATDADSADRVDIGQRVHSSFEGRPDGLTVDARTGRCRRPRAREDVSIMVDDAHGKLRASDVNSEHRPQLVSARRVSASAANRPASRHREPGRRARRG